MTIALSRIANPARLGLTGTFWPLACQVRLIAGKGVQG
jgi:hypothetical protein